MPARHLPARPDIRQLRHQAKDLLRAAHAGDPSANADFREYHPRRIDPATAKLADAQIVLARSYDAASWPQLVLACRVIDATSRDDFEALRQIVSSHPEVLQDRANIARGGWRAAVRDSANLGFRRVVEKLRGTSGIDVSALLARPGMQAWLDALRLLGRIGARTPTDAVGGAVEILNAADFALMADVGAEIRNHRGLVALALETYTRNPAAKHRILDVMLEQGISLPDTPPMAVHRGRLDLLEQHLRRDQGLLTRTFSHEEIWPPELECHADQSLALHGAPLGGATLLHMATDYEELDIARWLLDHGMDVNARASVDVSGFGGHAALFNCVVTYNAGRRDQALTRLLLERGADPNVRASIRKRLAFAKDKSVHEYREVTALGWGRVFHDQTYVSHGALDLIAEHGGHD